MQDTDRDRLALQIFTEICVLSEPERTATLNARCNSDEALKQRIVDLLKADGSAVGALDSVEQFLPTEIGNATNIAIKMQVSPDESLRNDYRLLRVLGEGGMATVYEAEQQHPRRLVAIKIVRSGSFSPELRRRFEYEAQVLAKLQHPNIAQLFEADTQPEGTKVCAYLAMELVRGIPIDEYAEKHKLGIRGRIELVLRVCEAIEYAHQMGVIHRDLKPANILVQEDGQPKVLDFGVARAINRDERWTTVLTHAGQVIGTLAYMSPEQVDGTRPADTRADVYALGVLLYKLLTGKLPVNVSDCGIAEAARRIGQDIPSPPSHHDRTIRGDLDVIIGKALEKEAARRYRSIHALAADLRRFLDGRAIEARGGSTFYVLRKTIWRYRQLTAVIAGFLALIVAFAIYAEMQSRKNQELARQAVAARDIAAHNAEELRRSLYLSNIGFAQAALETNDIGHITPLLDSCPPDLRGWEWGYLRGLSDRSQQTWPTKTGAPRSVDLSSDQQRIAVGSDGMVTVLDGPNHDGVEYTRAMSDGAVTVALSSDGRYLAAGPWMDELSVIDLNDCKELWKTPPGPAPEHPLLRRLRAACFSLDHKTLATAGFDGHIRLRDTMTGAVQRDIDAQCLSVLCMKFTDDGQSLIGGDDRGHLRMWKCNDGSVLRDLFEHDGSIACIAFTSDRSIFATGANDGKIVLRKMADWSEVKTLSPGKPIVWSLAFSPDGTKLAAGSDDNLLRLWNLNDDSAPALLRGHADTVNFVEFEPSGDALLSAAGDSTIKRWDLKHLNSQSTYSVGNVASLNAAFTSDGSGVFVVCNDGTVRLWDRVSGQERWQFVGPRTTLRTLALDEARGRLATSGDDNMVQIIDIKSGRLLQNLTWKTEEIGGAAFSPDGSILATGDGNGELKLWNANVNPATLTATMAAHDKMIMSLAFAPDGRHIATGGIDGNVKLWAIGNDKPVATARPSGTTVRDLHFDASGQLLAAAHTDGSIWILNGNSLESLHTLRGHQGAVNGVAFQPGTTRLASSGVDRTVRIWDVASTAQILTLRGHRRPIEHLAFSPDGSTLASTSLDGTVPLWESKWESKPAAASTNRQVQP